MGEAARKNQTLIAEEADLKTKFAEENGCEIYEFTDEDVAEFTAVVQPVIDEYKEIYGADACAAFGIE